MWVWSVWFGKKQSFYEDFLAMNQSAVKNAYMQRKPSAWHFRKEQNKSLLYSSIFNYMYVCVIINILKQYQHTEKKQEGLLSAKNWPHLNTSQVHPLSYWAYSK